MTTHIIQAEGLSKKFDEFLAVDNLSLNVHSGEILVLLGPNGAGKTTTVRMLTSILRPTKGWARIAGYDVTADAEKVRSLVGVLTEHHGLYGRMNAMEYLEFFGSLYKISTNESKNRSSRLMEQFGLSAGKKRLSEYSKGMRQKLALIRALLHEPPVILLDEPTSAMDPESAFTVRQAIRELRSSERTVVLCTHNLKEAEELADQIAIIKDGKIILNGKLGEVRRKLLGPREYLLKFTGENTLTDELDIPDVKLLNNGNDSVRFLTEFPEQTNHKVIQFMAQKGANIITLQEVTHSLEDIYLKIINHSKVDV